MDPWNPLGPHPHARKICVMIWKIAIPTYMYISLTNNSSCNDSTFYDMFTLQPKTLLYYIYNFPSRCMHFHGTCPSIICLCNKLNVIHKLDQVWTKISCPPKWWNPPKIYKPKAPNKGGKQGTKWNDPQPNQKTKTPYQKGNKEEWQKIKYLPLFSRSISKKERGCTLKITPILKEPSLARMWVYSCATWNQHLSW